MNRYLNQNQSQRVDENIMTDINSGVFPVWGSEWSNILDVQSLLNTLKTETQSLRILLTSLPNRDRSTEFEKRLRMIEQQIEATIKGRMSRVVGGQIVNSHLEDLLVGKEARIEYLENAIKKYELEHSQKQNRLGDVEVELERLQQQMHIKNEQIREMTSKLNEQIVRSGLFRDALATIKRNIDGQRGKNDIDKIALNRVNLPAILTEGANINIKQLEKMTMTRKDEKQMIIKNTLLGLAKDIEDYLKGTKQLSDNNLNNSLRPIMNQLNIVAMDDTHIQYRQMRSKMEAMANLYFSEIKQLQNVHPELKDIQFSRVFEELVGLELFSKMSIVNGIMFIEKPGTSKQASILREYMNKVVIEIKAIADRFPKLREELNSRGVWAMLEQPLWKIGNLDAVSQVVQYVPEPVRVETIIKTGDRSKTEMHLRATIKALLADLQLAREGRAGQIDANILAGLTTDLDGFESLEELFRLYQPPTSCVGQVDRIVEKIVEKVVQIPKIVKVQCQVQNVVVQQKLVFVEQPAPYPVEVIKHVPVEVEKIVVVKEKQIECRDVEVIREVPVEIVREVPKVIEKQKIIQVPLIQQREVVVTETVPHVIVQTKICEIQVQRLAEVRTFVQKIKEVPVQIEKAVPVVVVKPQVIEVEKVVEKIVLVPQDREVRVIENHVQTKWETVELIIQKIVPIEVIKEVIVEVEVLVQKIVQVVRVQEVIKEVQVFRDKIVERQVPVVMQQIVQKPIQVVREVIKEVEKIVQVPLYTEKIVEVEVEVTKLVVECVEKEVIREVPVEVPKIMKEVEIREIEKHIHHVEKVPQVVTITVEKPVLVPVIQEKIKVERVCIDKIVEKLVEVPKVVQVEKIVEKIVVVPRIVERVVTVPQIVEKIVDRIVEVEKLVEVEKIVEVPVIQTETKFIDRFVNHIADKQIAVEVVVEKPVPCEKIVEKIKEVKVPVNVPVEVKCEKEVKLFNEKIIPVMVQVPNCQYIEKQKIVPYGMPQLVECVVEKTVPVRSEIPIVKVVEKEREKLVVARQFQPVLQEIERVVEKCIENTRIVEVEKTVPIEKVKVEVVDRIVTNNVPVERVVEVLKEVNVIAEKPVIEQTTIEIPVPCEVAIEKAVLTEKAVEVIKSVPVFIRHEVEKLIENWKIEYINAIEEKIVKAEVIKEKIVPVVHEVVEVKEVQKTVQKLCIQKEYQIVEKAVPHIQKEIQVVQCFSDKIVEVTRIIEKLVQVPTIMQKIVEKIILMPQIVEIVRDYREVQCVEDLQGIVRPKKNLSQYEIIDIFAGTLEKHKKSCVQISQLPKDILDIVDSRASRLSRSNYSTQDSFISSLSRPTSQIIELMASKLHEIKQRQPTIDLGQSENLYERYLNSQGIQWLRMQRSLSEYKNEVNRLKLINDRTNEMLQNLKLSHDILFQKYSKHDNVIKLILEVANQHNLIDILVILGMGPVPNTKPQIVPRSPEEDKLHETIKKLQMEILQKNDVLSSRDRQLNHIKSQFAKVQLRYAQAMEESRRQLKTSSDQNRRLGEEIRVSQTIKDNLEKEVQKLRSELAALRVEYNLYKNESIELKSNLQKVEMNKSFSDLKNSYESQLRQLRTTNESLKRDLQRQRQSLILEIDRLKGLISSNERDFNKMLEENKLMHSDNYSMNIEINNLKAQLNSEITNYKNQIRILQAQLRNLEMQKASVDKEAQNEVIGELQKKQGEINQLNSKIEKMSEEMSNMNKTIHTREKELIFIRSHNDTLERNKAQNALLLETVQNQSKAARKSQVTLIDQINSLRSQRDGLKKELQRMRSTTFQTQSESGMLRSMEIGKAKERQEPQTADAKRLERQQLSQSGHESTREQRSSHLISPEIKQTEKSIKSPVDLLRETTMTPVSKKDEPEYTNAPLNQIISSKIKEDNVSWIMLALVQKLMENLNQGILNLYSPDNIIIQNYNPNNIDKIKIQLLNPLKNTEDSVYSSPEFLRGDQITEKSVVYNVGMIWDALIHAKPYYSSTTGILTHINDYKVVESKMNPIFKNTLFEMLYKDANKRVTLREVKDRVLLQKQIRREERKK